MADDVKLLAKFMNTARGNKHVPKGTEMWDIVDSWVALDTGTWLIGRIINDPFAATIKGPSHKDKLVEYHAFAEGGHGAARCGVRVGGDTQMLARMIGGPRMRHRNVYCSVCSCRYLVSLQGDSWPSTNGE